MLYFLYFFAFAVKFLQSLAIFLSPGSTCGCPWLPLRLVDFRIIKYYKKEFFQKTLIIHRGRRP
jgi:hypothetical protein